MSKKPVIKNNKCYLKIKSILEEARHNVYRHVNSVMVKAYWNIGRIIVVEEQQGERKAEYGAKLISEVSVRLSKDFGKGFDERNLFFMRQFYLSFPKLNALRSELSWTHYRLLIKVEREEIRQFYLLFPIRSTLWSELAI